MNNIYMFNTLANLILFSEGKSKLLGENKGSMTNVKEDTKF